jgi:hypothetical protein
VKEVVRRDREEKLKIEKKENNIYYFCPKCGQLLVTTNENNEWRAMSSCKDFQWEEISISCFVGIGDECDPQEIYKLRKNAIITIFDDLFVNLLIPKQI